MKKVDLKGKNVELLEDAIADYTMRGKTLITELNLQLGLNDPKSQIVTNPFALDTTSFMSCDMSLDGQLTSFLTKGYGHWVSVIGNEYKGQNLDEFKPVTPLMLKFWTHPSVVGTYPNLSVIACHVSTSLNKWFLYF